MLRKFLHYLNIKDELEDVDSIHAEIERAVVFKGTNLWVLVFAIIVASVGLNTNSTAVIIGAMLISPLMGPINGMGYSLATYNFALFRRALRNFLFAVAASLVTSTIYFTISPVSTAQSELLARTSPTIYDVLIALFGGLAGIVAISSRLKGNVLPGVAIATALMPPLCTAGYGLATAQWTFFFGAFYLFTINTVFIGISSVVMSQVLNFPIRTLIDPVQKKRVNQYISLIIVLTLLPSIYFGYQLVQQERFISRANAFTTSVVTADGAYLLRHEMNAVRKEITLVYGGNGLSNEAKEQIYQKAKDFGIAEATININQGFAINKTELDETTLLKNKISALTFSLNKLQQEKDSLHNLTAAGAGLLQELQLLYKNISACSLAQTTEYSDSARKQQVQTLVVLRCKKGALTAANKEQLRKWLQLRYTKTTLRLLFEEE